MSGIITAPPITYKPEFNSDDGVYVDKCPFARNSRNNPWHKCPCNGFEFNKTIKFNSHIKSACHRNYIENYSDNIKELEDLKNEMKGLLAENELLKRKNASLNKKMELMEEKMKRCENECRMLRNMKEVFNYLIDNDEEEFQDCNEE